MTSRRRVREFPLTEVFGFLPGSATPDAQSYLDNRWCPFNNPTGPNCTKDRVEDPLGVCSILHNDHPTITCPVRFRQDWRIVRDAAAFFFPDRPKTLPPPRLLSEVPLKDGNGKSAGNIDMVLVTLDTDGTINRLRRIGDSGGLHLRQCARFVQSLCSRSSELRRQLGR